MQVIYSTANINIKTRVEDATFGCMFDPKFLPFKIDSTHYDATLRYKFDLCPSWSALTKKSKLKIKDLNWEIRQNDTAWFYKYESFRDHVLPYKVISIYNSSHTENFSYIMGISKEKLSNANFPALSIFSTDQILLSRLLLPRYGMLIHGNSIIIDNKCYLVLGLSGAGKSTLSKILANQGAQIISDDRTIVTTDGHPCVHGSWLHGTHEITSTISKQLDGILVLDKAKTNRVGDLEKAEIGAMLMSSIIKPLFDNKEWSLLLDIITKLTVLPFYRLSFNLNEEDNEQINILKEL